MATNVKTDPTMNITSQGNKCAREKFGSPYETEAPAPRPAAKPALYRCSVCGVVHEGGENPPKNCLKCDNDRFYRVR
ncbi:MAG TPA: hypothetical protein PKY53_03745 [Clostridia bacterium]|jgi:rubrerythrin|nr:hypothetical protein [Clostridia bacterium]